MNITLKTKDEIAKMRLGGKIASRILNTLAKQIKEGMTTIELDKMAETLIIEAGAKPSFKGYKNYPNSICVSINEEVVHGIPGSRIIKNNDLVGIDLGIFYQGFHTDTALTVGIGQISPAAQKLLKITELSLNNAIHAAKEGVFLGDLQAIIQETVENAGLSVVRDLVGHGVGRDLQEAPPIPNYGKKGTGPRLKEGMTLAIEPMVSAGDWHIKILPDGWTVVTADRSLAAHFEHTIAIGKEKAEILTR